MVKDVIIEHPNIQRVPAVKFYLISQTGFDTPERSRRGLTAKGPGERRVNIDIAVLKPENQTPTTVTPLINTLAQQYFRENLRVVAPRPPRDLEKIREKQNARERVHRELLRLIRYCYDRGKCKWKYEKVDSIRNGSKYLRAITVDEVLYKVGSCLQLFATRSFSTSQTGDTIIMPIGDDPANPKLKGRDKDMEEKRFSLPLPNEEISMNKSFEDFFW